MDMFSGAACGALGDPFDPPAANASSPSTNFGFTVLGAALTIFLAFSYDAANKRGLVDAAKERLFSALGVSGGGSSGGSSGKGMRVSTAVGATAAGGRENAFGGDSRDSSASTPFGSGGYGSL